MLKITTNGDYYLLKHPQDMPNRNIFEKHYRTLYLNDDSCQLMNNDMRLRYLKTEVQDKDIMKINNEAVKIASIFVNDEQRPYPTLRSDVFIYSPYHKYSIEDIEYLETYFKMCIEHETKELNIIFK